MNAGAVVHQSVRGKAVWGARAALVAVVAAASSLSISCGKQTREGTSASYLIITALEGASGAEPTKFAGTMFSDVLTIVKTADGPRPTIFGDPGRVRMTIALKDVGTPGNATTPTTNNFVTIDRYHVTYIRADGHNVPGVDVPYPFDGAMTMTVGASESSGGFLIVRNDAKMEAPLTGLLYSGGILTTIAEVTFYGHDQTGRAVSVTGRILIDFGDFGDPA